MSETNKHGLGRYVPADIRRVIRRRCGFGCVICGIGFFNYEHFEPDYCDAKEHDPKSMTLLCMQCNQRRNYGTLSVATVKRHNLEPMALRKGFAEDWLDIGVDEVEVLFAGCSFIGCKTLLDVRGTPVLSVLPPEEEGHPFRISGVFTDSAGAVTLRIDENQWLAETDNWDVEWVGKTVTIRRGKGDIALVMTTLPPNILIIEKINMFINGVRLVGTQESLEVSIDGGPVLGTFKCKVRNCDIGIKVGSSGRTP